MRGRLRCESWRERLALLFIFLAASYAVGDAVLAPAPAPKEPGFIDTVLGSRAVVASVRLAVTFAAAFVVASVVALIARGQWLTRVGPVQVSDRVTQLDGIWQENELSANMEKYVEALQRNLVESDELIQQVRRDQEERDGQQSD